jgi:hypothetical protein
MKIHPGFMESASPNACRCFDGGIGTVCRLDNASKAIDPLIASRAGSNVFVVFEAAGRYDKALRQALSATGLSPGSTDGGQYQSRPRRDGEARCPAFHLKAVAKDTAQQYRAATRSKTPAGSPNIRVFQRAA